MFALSCPLPPRRWATYGPPSALLPSTAAFRPFRVFFCTIFNPDAFQPFLSLFYGSPLREHPFNMAAFKIALHMGRIELGVREFYVAGH